MKKILFFIISALFTVNNVFSQELGRLGFYLDDEPTAPKYDDAKPNMLEKATVSRQDLWGLNAWAIAQSKEMVSKSANYLFYKNGSNAVITPNVKPILFLDNAWFNEGITTRRHGWTTLWSTDLNYTIPGITYTMAPLGNFFKGMSTPTGGIGFANAVINPIFTIDLSPAKYTASSPKSFSFEIRGYIQHSSLFEVDEYVGEEFVGTTKRFTTNKQNHFWEIPENKIKINVQIDDPSWKNANTTVCNQGGAIDLKSTFNTVDYSNWVFSCPSNPSLVSNNSTFNVSGTAPGSYEIIATKKYANTTSNVIISKTITVISSPSTPFLSSLGNICNTTGYIFVSKILRNQFSYCDTYEKNKLKSAGFDGRDLYYPLSSYKTDNKLDLAYGVYAEFSYEGDLKKYAMILNPKDTLFFDNTKKLSSLVFKAEAISGCSGSQTFSYSINIISNTIPINTGGNFNICLGEKSELSTALVSPSGGTWFGENVKIENGKYVYDATKETIGSNKTVYYDVNLNTCKASVSRNVFIKDVPKIEIGSDLTYCQGVGVQTLKVISPAPLLSNQTINWNLLSGSAAALVGSTLNPDKLGAGTYILQGMLNTDYTTNKCYSFDTVKITVATKLDLPSVDNDFFCEPRDIQLKVNSAQPNISYLWYDNADKYITTSSVYSVPFTVLAGKTSVTYKIKSSAATTGGGSCFSDVKTVTISKRTAPVLKLDTTFSICQGLGGTIKLEGQKIGGVKSDKGIWSGPFVNSNIFDLSSNPQAGSYALKFDYNFYPQDNTCNVSATSKLDIYPTPIIDAGISQNFCNNSGFQELDQTTIQTNNLKHTWSLNGVDSLVKQIGDKYFVNTDNEFFIPNPNPYLVKMSVVSAKGCKASDYREIYILSSPTAPIVLDTTICGSGTVKFKIQSPKSGSTYKWYDSSDSTEKVISTTNSYTKFINKNIGVYVIETNVNKCVSEKGNAYATVYLLDDFSVGKDLILCKNTKTYDLTKDVDSLFRTGEWSVNNNVLGIYKTGQIYTDLVLDVNGTKVNDRIVAATYTYIDKNACKIEKTRSISVISSLTGSIFSFRDTTMCQNALPFSLNDISKKSGATITGGNGGIKGGVFYPSLVEIIKTQNGTYGVADLNLSLNENGCVYTDNIVVKILPSPSLPQVNLTTNGCIGDSTLLEVLPEANTEATISYFDFNTTTYKTISNQNKLYLPITEKTYTVSVDIVDLSGCSLVNPDVYQIQNNNVVGEILSTKESVLVGEGIGFRFNNKSLNEIKSYDWNFGKGYMSTEEEPYQYFYIADTLTPVLNIVSSLGCKSSIKADSLIKIYGEEGVIPDANLSSGATNSNYIKISEILVYPTYTRDFVFIKSSENILSYKLINSQGLEIESNSSLVDKHINISSLSVGLYYIVLTGSTNKVVQKIIKY